METADTQKDSFITKLPIVVNLVFETAEQGDRRRARSRARWRASVKCRYAAYKRSAKKRGYAFELSLAEFKQLVTSNCFYCGERPSPMHGVDRYDNTQGYITGSNCVTACKWCNTVKSKETYEQFIRRCVMIAQRHPASTTDTSTNDQEPPQSCDNNDDDGVTGPGLHLRRAQ